MARYTLKAGRNDRFFTKAINQATKKVFYLAVPEELSCNGDWCFIYKVKKFNPGDPEMWFADTEAETFVFISKNEVESFKERFFRGEI